MKFKVIPIIFTLGLSVAMFAQDPGGNIVVGSSSFTVINKNEAEDVTIGKPYINEEFMESVVLDFEHPLSLRYNAYTDEMEFEHEGKLYALKKEDYPVVYLGIQKLKYEYLPYAKGRENLSGFLRVLEEGDNYKLYKKEEVSYTPYRKAASSYEKDSPAQYKREKDKFFIKIGDSSIVEMPTNRNRFSKLFGSKENEINKFIKDNRINLDSEADLIRTIKYANSL